MPDLRVIVYRGYPVLAMMRLSTRKSDGKANLHQGALGVGIDLATGRAVAAVQHNRPVHVHPDTDQPLSDLSVPDWDHHLMLATRGFEMTGLGYLGADIVLDRERGPLVLEFNARPGLAIQTANRCGLLPRLKRIEEQTPKMLPGPEQRIRIAKEFFGSGARLGNRIAA